MISEPAAPADADSLRAAVRRAGFDAGFDQVGFAPAEGPAHAGEYQAWLSRGWHGEMAYMERADAVARRLDPKQALPGCRTVIMVSLVYGPHPEGHVPAGSVEDGPDVSARVARYAAGEDYHHVFERRLEAFGTAVARLVPGERWKRYVDYGPVLERDHAQRAGLGWVGKNTLLIHPEHGSYLLLAELLTTLELEPDPPFTADRCGTCTRCIDACPTDAIRGPRRLDARRCISYLTIELRGSIPEHLREPIGTHVFGCDICQEVCPWNREAPSPRPSPFAPEPGRPLPPAGLLAWAEELLDLDDEGFGVAYRGTAFRRPGRDGLLRNIAVGLGNAAGPDALPALQRMQRESSDVVRDHATWAVARIKARAR